MSVVRKNVLRIFTLIVLVIVAIRLEKKLIKR